MEFRGRWNRVVACAAVISCAFVPASAQATRHRLASTAVYHKYVDPLLSEPDFGTEYSEDGAADASVLFPQRGDNPYARPSEPVLTIVGAMTAAFPALIDCLSDRRTTSVVFDGNNITKRMNVSVGYVCLDILMAEAKGRGLNDPEDGDGLGASMSPSFYFRPDDYWNCWPNLHECDPRPWVLVVQANWRRKFVEGQLRFHNPYDDLRISEYSEFTTQGMKHPK
jgi:hypothetical protein